MSDLQKESVSFISSQYIFILGMVLNFNTIWGSSNQYQSIWPYFVFLLLLCALIILCIQKRIKNINKIIKFTLLLVIYFGLQFMMRPYNIGFAGQLLSYIILSGWYIIIYSGYSSIISLVEKYNNVMFMIALSALFFYIFGSVFSVISPTGSLQSNWASGNDGTGITVPGYLGIYFEAQVIDAFDEDGLVRNTAIFTEAPMCSFCYCISMLFEILIFKRTLMATVFFMMVLSTISSTGYVLMIALIAYMFFNRKVSGFWIKIAKSFFSIFIIIGVMYMVEMIFSQKATSMSAILRLDDYLVGFITWLQSPFWGNGLGNVDCLIANMDSWRAFSPSYQGFSNAPLLVLAQGGIYYGIVYLIAFFIAFKNAIKIKSRRYIILVMSLGYLFVLTVIPYRLLFIFFLYVMAFPLRDFFINREFE